MQDEVRIEILWPEEAAYDWDDPELPPGTREYMIALQPSLRRDATALGNFRTCPLPKCRRGKRCSGRHPLDKLAIEFDHWSYFPPCINTTEMQTAMLCEGRRYGAVIRAEMLAQGADPESLGPPDADRCVFEVRANQEKGRSR